MIQLRTKAFTIVEPTITQAVLKWIAIKQSFDQFEDIEILSIEKSPTKSVRETEPKNISGQYYDVENATVSKENQPNNQSQT